VQHDLRKPKEQMLLRAHPRRARRRGHRHGRQDVRAGARGAGRVRAALDHAGVPYFVSEFEENMTSFDHLEIQLETFVENLLFD
jgi:benzoyl-CoA reductase subunit C